MIKIRNKRRYKGPGVYVGRGYGSMLGNPYNQHVYGLETCLGLYVEWIWFEWNKDGPVKNALLELVEIARHGDLTLICWCITSDIEKENDKLKCHAQIIRSLINSILRSN